ncbi:hypothetical protein SLEP1_g40058 [Rubroshorea leprosula]|uniref:Uncharacterized protein n=1 Tax=Rubroshorea leprosula TaxID=152421 RepID=A0AAV5L3K5_9ROSI|nr:hypothetical protein SLEP1_g40058 [Rubroshorea leprosula]
MAPCNLGTGSGSQNYGQGSGSNHLNGGHFNFSPSLALGNPCGGPVNIGPGAGGRTNVLLLEVLTFSRHQPIWHLDSLVFRVVLYVLS